MAGTDINESAYDHLGVDWYAKESFDFCFGGTEDGEEGGGEPKIHWVSFGGRRAIFGPIWAQTRSQEVPPGLIATSWPHAGIATRFWTF